MKDNTKKTTSSGSYSLTWDEQHDDNGNSIYEAASPFHDDGSPFYFRIRQRLYKNKHEFVEDSAMELMMDIEDPRTWTSLEDAKSAMLEDANFIVKSHVDDTKDMPPETAPDGSENRNDSPAGEGWSSSDC